MKNKHKLLLPVLLFTLLSACESGMFIRGSHSHYYHEQSYQPISWGYTVGDPILYDAGYYMGHVYPFASPYGAVVHEGEGAVAQ